MINCSFIGRGKDCNLSEIIPYYQSKGVRCWQKGDTISKKNKWVAKDSGIRFDVCSFKTFSAAKHIDLLEKKMVKFLKTHKRIFRDLKECGAEKLYFDVGIFEEKKTMVQLGFKGEVLKLIYDFGMDLEVTCYHLDYFWRSKR